MAYDLTTLVSRVQKRIRDSNYPASEITDAINDTQRDVFNEYQLPLMEATQVYTTVSNVSDITNGVGLPSNYQQAIDLTDTSTGRERVIPWRQLILSDTNNPDQDDQPANYPQYWYKLANTIRLYPKPAGAYPLALRYYKTPTELINDSDVPEIPPEFGEILVSGPAYRIFQVKDQYDIAAIHQNKYDEILQKLAVRYSQVQVGVPHVMPTNTVGMTSYAPRGGNF
jgi:hypothetical protein